jgi:hypothetical protein
MENDIAALNNLLETEETNDYAEAVAQVGLWNTEHKYDIFEEGSTILRVVEPLTYLNAL